MRQEKEAELKKLLFDIFASYDSERKIRINNLGYICLTDLAKFFNSKRLDNWLRLKTANKFIGEVKNNFPSPVLIAKKGRCAGGTYANIIIAMEFASWLSSEIKMKIYEYIKRKARKG